MEEFLGLPGDVHMRLAEEGDQRGYRGPFLASEDAGWTQPARERLRSQYLRLVEQAGEHFERAARFDAALACYEHAVGLDPAAERIYRRLMRSLHAQGRSAEALHAMLRGG